MSTRQKRPYNKKSDYWSQFGDRAEPQPIQKSFAKSETYTPAFAGEAYATHVLAPQVALGSYSRAGSSTTDKRSNRASTGLPSDRFSIIRKGLLPFDCAADGINVRDAIILCQKAYANVAIFRNAIDLMSEFANTTIYLEGGTASSRKFIETWLRVIGIKKLTDQFFREYYRSGNIFFFKVDGGFAADDLAKMPSQFRSSLRTPSGSFPLRYLLLNPVDIMALPSTSFYDNSYRKVLSQYEIERLKKPSNPHDQAVFDALPKETKEKIAKRDYQVDGVYMDLDPKNLRTCFYKKQDYEPFAIPFGYPVLDDINAKLEMKKFDQAVMRTIENIILLITMGAEPEKGGINQANLAAMQALFTNESSGRVLVADYTTKAEFIIPDISKIVGEEKYKVINQDIREGLQNVVIGQEKYSNTEVKTRMFLDRLGEGRDYFVTEFLNPEIEAIGEALGMRSVPEAKFVDLDMRNEDRLLQINTRLMELGILTPEQGMEVIQKGRFPDPDAVLSAQEEYIEQRRKGYYNPIVGGQPMDPNPMGVKDAKDIVGTAPKQEPPKVVAAPRKAAPTGGRPTGTKKNADPAKKATATYSPERVRKAVLEIEKLESFIQAKTKEKSKAAKLNKAQKTLVRQLTEAVVIGEEKQNWEEVASACVKDSTNIMKIGTLDGVAALSAEHELKLFPAALMYHSRNEAQV